MSSIECATVRETRIWGVQFSGSQFANVLHSGFSLSPDLSAFWSQQDNDNNFPVR